MAADIAEIDLDGVIVYVITPEGTPDDDRRVVPRDPRRRVHHGGRRVAVAPWVSTRSRRAYACGQWTSGCHRIIPTRRRSTTASPPTAPCCKTISPTRSSLAVPPPAATSPPRRSSARDEGLPLPAAAVLLTPEADLTESGDTFQTNAGVDTMLREGRRSAFCTPATMTSLIRFSRRSSATSPTASRRHCWRAERVRSVPVEHRAHASRTACRRSAGRAPYPRGSTPRRLPRLGAGRSRAPARGASLHRRGLADDMKARRVCAKLGWWRRTARGQSTSFLVPSPLCG